MHALSVLKHACLTALDHDEDEPADKVEFYSVVDPQSVLELVGRAERLSDDELKALGRLLDELVDFVKRSPTSAERDDLVLRSRQLRGLMEI